MASPRYPTLVGTGGAIPALTDPARVAETYANTLAGLGFNNGNVHITLGVVRSVHSITDPNDNEHVVAVRTVIPLPVMAALVEAYGQLMSAMQMQPQPPSKVNENRKDSGSDQPSYFPESLRPWGLPFEVAPFVFSPARWGR